MARRLTTSNLISEVRSLVDETNQEALDDARDIIPALNRAQDLCAGILARSYNPPLIAYKSLTLPASTREFDVPEEAFEERVVKIEVEVSPGIFEPVPAISFQDATRFESNAVTACPNAFSQIGQVIRLYPAYSGAYPLRVWYAKDPLPLVKEQGTVTRINGAANYVVVDSVGADLSAEIDSYSSYVNFVDGQSGRVKGTCQIQSISGNRITFRSTPTRSSVLNMDVTGTLPDDLELDDLLCTSDGTCVSILKKPVSNYLIQAAAAELASVKFGVDSSVVEDVKKTLEQMVENSWAGRPQILRVKLQNSSWTPSYTRRLLR